MALACQEGTPRGAESAVPSSAVGSPSNSTSHSLTPDHSGTLASGMLPVAPATTGSDATAPTGSGGPPSSDTSPDSASGAPTLPNPPDSNPDAGDAAPSEPTPMTSLLLGDVTLSTPSQTFQGELTVELGTAVADAEIRYTTDGSVPTVDSTLYAGTAVTLTETTQLRAQAFVAGAPSGALTTGLYIARDFDVSSDLPLFVLHGYGQGKPEDKEVAFDSAVMVFETVNGTATLSTLPTLATRAGYHIRGQSSASFPQAPYKVEFWDNGDQDADYPVLGMPSDSDWALIPPYYDRTLIRNPFIYDLGRELGLEAPRWAYAEVYLNNDGGPLTTADYQGVYWFTETIKNNKVRTNLKQLEATDTTLPKLSGGYIFKFDQAASEEPRLLCTGSEPLPGFSFGGGMGGGGGTPAESGTCWNDLEVVDPEPLNAEAAAWLTSYVQTLHDGLHATPMADYSEWIDVASFIDYLIINELSLNVDAYVRSAYYHKDRDGKLTAGPLWDYNFALGGVGAQAAVPEEGETGFRFSGTRNVNNWYQKLTSDANFMTQVRARYTALRETLLSQPAVEARMTALTAPIAQAAVRDFERWPVADVITSASGFTGGPTVETWEGQVQVMHDFLLERLTWLDANL